MTSGKNTSHTVDGWKNLHQLRLGSLSTIVYKVSIHPRWLAGFLPSTVSQTVGHLAHLEGEETSISCDLRSWALAYSKCYASWTYPGIQVGFLYGKDSSLVEDVGFSVGWRNNKFENWGLAANLFPVLTLSSSIGKPLRRVIFLVLTWCCGRKCMNEWIALSQNNMFSRHQLKK